MNICSGVIPQRSRHNCPYRCSCSIVVSAEHTTALLDGRAAAHDDALSGLPVYPRAVFGLHCPSGLRFDHLAETFVILPQRYAFDMRRHPRFVAVHQVGAQVDIFFVDMSEVLGCAPVVGLALPDVARAYVVRCLCHNQ